jgi:hypothetical protein
MAYINSRKLKFVPDRENDLLMLVLGNPEKGGRTRGLGPSYPWSLGFPSDKVSTCQCLQIVD